MIENELILGCVSNFIGVRSEVFGLLADNHKVVRVGFIQPIAGDSIICANPSNEAILLDGWNL